MRAFVGSGTEKKLTVILVDHAEEPETATFKSVPTPMTSSGELWSVAAFTEPSATFQVGLLAAGFKLESKDFGRIELPLRIFGVGWDG